MILIQPWISYESYVLLITFVNITHQSVDQYLPSIHSWDSSPWQLLYIPLFCVCVFLTVCCVVLVFFKCIINLTSFLFKSRFISLLLFIHLFFTFFFFWLSNFSRMKRLRLVNYFFCFCFLRWNCRVIIHSVITFLPFQKDLQCSSLISILT